MKMFSEYQQLRGWPGCADKAKLGLMEQATNWNALLASVVAVDEFKQNIVKVKFMICTNQTLIF